MRSVHFIVHYLPGVEARVPTRALADFFRCYGIELSFEDGARMPSNLTTFAEFHDVLSQWYPKDPPVGAAAHLFVGAWWLDTGGGLVNGMLLEPTRGATAVFTRSMWLEQHPDQLEQVCAHEICHVLNLTHPAGEMEYGATEAPEQDRDPQDIGVAASWKRARVTRPPGVNVYPLLKENARHLQERVDRDVLPWGTSFFGGAVGIADCAVRVRRSI
jgi:hypothetical protein